MQGTDTAQDPQIQFTFETQIYGRGFRNHNQSVAMYDASGWFVFEAVVLGNPAGSNKLLRRSYWDVKKEADTWKTAMLALTLGKRPPNPMKQIDLKITRYGSVMKDYDGLVSSLKFLIDGLVLGKVIEDDSWENTGPWEVDQKKSKRAEARVEVLVVGRANMQNS